MMMHRAGEESAPTDMPSGEEGGFRPAQPGEPGAKVVVRAGWNLPRPEKLPNPTYWPAVMSLGITLLLWGLITTLLITLVGLVLFASGLIGWIGELRDGYGE